MERATNAPTGSGRWTIRSLGKAVDPADPERGRRKLQRHLKGLHMPSVASRVGYAEALGLDRAAFLAPEEIDEDEALTAPLSRQIEALRAELARLEAEAAA